MNFNKRAKAIVTAFGFSVSTEIFDLMVKEVEHGLKEQDKITRENYSK